MIIYDIEIKKAILGRRETPVPGVKYCEGWKDFENMGVSTLCCYDYNEERYRVFCEDNMNEVETLFREHDIIVGFNSIAFDNSVLACEIPDLTKEYLDGKSYDILVEIWEALGLSREFKFPTHLGYGLDAMVKVNKLASGKTGNGALAPMWYQAGRTGRYIDYCLGDVWLTKRLLDKIIKVGVLTNPKNNEMLMMEPPKHGRIGLNYGPPKDDKGVVKIML